MCSYTCTSKIPLTDYCRKAKTMIGGMKKKWN
jgi:Na+-translocating ferredoxin:NAD+ oxidoreductase RnfC subunit